MKYNEFLKNRFGIYTRNGRQELACIDPYIDECDGCMHLDGYFDVEELEAIVWWMRKNEGKDGKTRKEEKMKIYTVLRCFWEGDDWFVTTFKGNFSSEKKAVAFTKERFPNMECKFGRELPEEPEPNRGYWTPSFIYIYENTV